MAEDRRKFNKPPPPAPKGNQYAKGHHFGRPKIYDDAFIEKEAEAFLDWMSEDENVWFEDFALQRGYSPQRLYEWEKSNAIFSESFKIVQAMQKGKLVKGGLFEQFNAGFTKFVMYNACGWVEKQQLSGDAASPFKMLITKVDGSSKDLVSDDAEQD